MILGELILQYHLKFAARQERPVNLNADELWYPDPATRVLLKQRRQIH